MKESLFWFDIDSQLLFATDESGEIAAIAAKSNQVITFLKRYPK